MPPQAAPRRARETVREPSSKHTPLWLRVDRMKEVELAYCGLDCDKCPAFIATANDDDALRQKTAADWSRLYPEMLAQLGIMECLKPGDINCRGCHSKTNHFVGCMKCAIRECSQGRSFKTCASCNEYETCDLLKAFYSMSPHQYAKDKLDRIRSGL